MSDLREIALALLVGLIHLTFLLWTAVGLTPFDVAAATLEALGIPIPKAADVWKPFPGPQTEAVNSEADELFYGGAAGGGKALSVHSIIPTPRGYRQMLDLRRGDEVFGMDGQIYRITGTSEIMTGHRVFDVVFDDGTIIRADADHRWHTFTNADREALHRRSAEFRAKRRASRPSRSTGKRPWLALRNSRAAAEYVPAEVTGGIRTTLEIRNTLVVREGKTKRTNHAIRIAAPLDLPERELPISPYVLGFWLGDGNSYAGRVTVGDNYIDEAVQQFQQEGFALTKVPSDRLGYTVRGLQKLLRLNGFLRNKHIPEGYLFASVAQRQALLQGLMDTDGYVRPDGICEFYNSKESLVKSVSRLLHTLGIKHTVRTKKAPVGTSYQPSYRIKFVAPFPVFRLSAKLSRQKMELRDTQKWRYIVDVREVDSEPVKCIAIDAPDHLYLAGEECVPTHNSDLLLGLAITQHRRSLILRREHTQIEQLEDRAHELLDDTGAAYNGQKLIWRDIPGKRRIRFGGVPHEKNVTRFQGRPNDLLEFDEITAFSKYQYKFLQIWNRTDIPGQRVRTVCAGNPPTTPEGQWVIDYWGAWLKPGHPGYPTPPGVLRWYAEVDGVEQEFPNGDVITHKGKPIKPRSRTFIPARVQDNPVYMATGYDLILSSLPEPFRSMFGEGRFDVAAEDDRWQTIPSQWVMLAMERWQRMERPNVALRCVGMDVARGGDDATTLARLYGNWFDTILSYRGKETDDGPKAADKLLPITGLSTPIFIDVGGIGASAYDSAKQIRHNVTPVNFSSAPTEGATDRSGQFQFLNLRAEIWWKMREALDPASGEDVALPYDLELLGDLCSARYKEVGGKIQIEDKDTIRRRLGRSPDKGDAVVMTYWGAKYEPPAPSAATIAFTGLF